MSQSIFEILERGPATSKQLQSQAGLSQTAVSLQIRKAGDRILHKQDGRTRLYMLTCFAFNSGDRLPLYMVDAHGNSTTVACILPLAHGGFYVKPDTRMPAVLLGESGDGFYDDLPYFLDDLKPQGFMGRQIATELAHHTGEFPTDPRDWSTEHIGQYLTSNGDDLPGNFKVGHQAHLRLRFPPLAFTENDYPTLADEALKGVKSGSSAGGEQPKFTAFNSNRSAHVIVKFSPKGDDPVARRWRDILITEFHAVEALHKKGFPAVEARLIEGGGRLFFESTRFDRVAEHGRLSLISLSAVDAEFTGIGANWPKVINALFERQLISKEHAYDAIYMWHFGRLINNTDMHLGNLSLAIDGDVFRLLPVYDMCSMGFSPKASEVIPFSFTPPAKVDAYFDEVKRTAYDFWERVSNDPRISIELRDFLELGNPINLGGDDSIREILD